MTLAPVSCVHGIGGVGVVAGRPSYPLGMSPGDLAGRVGIVGSTLSLSIGISAPGESKEGCPNTSPSPSMPAPVEGGCKTAEMGGQVVVGKAKTAGMGGQVKEVIG